MLLNETNKRPKYKTKHGQVFLKKLDPVISMINKVAPNITNNHTVLEIGGGEGQLNEMIINNLECK